MPARLSRPDFAALVRRAGLPIADTEIDEIYAGWPFVEAMLDRLRTQTDGTARDRAAEPAHIFRPDAFTGGQP